ncbi:MAG: YsnF/AvaK domain-containing protein [Chloroflexota bacterium]|nr:YsnF/AvaK domain-containing protein [Chloroflexota bacterium]
MIDRKNLRQGMQVYSGEDKMLGTIERMDSDSITVNGQQYEFSSIERAEGNRVYLTRQVGASTDRAPATGRGQAAEGDQRLEVHEERLNVQKRQADLGEVQVRKEVVTEQQTVPVELMREEVHVEQRDVADRPMTEADRAGAFQEGTIRVPVRGEEAVVTKEAVVTGEVVINKERTTERQQVTDTVRKEVMHVDENYDKHRAAYEQEYAKRPDAAGSKFADVEPHFRTGYGAAIDQRYTGKSFEEVEPELRQSAGATGGDNWERIKREVREGFTRARDR